MARLNVKIDKCCQWEYLPEGYNAVRVEYGHCPPGGAVVFLRRVTCEEKFWYFRTKVNDIGKREMEKKEKLKQVTKYAVGDFCLAPYDVDEYYYRARIDVIDGHSIGVFYVDYGSFGFVDEKHVVYPPPGIFLEVPFQIIECNMASVKPVAIDDWPDEVCDFLDDFPASEEICYAKVVKTYDLALTTGGCCYDVVLIWGADEDLVNVNKYMATIGGAPLPDADEEAFTAMELEVKSPGWEANAHCRLGRCYTGNSCPYQQLWPEVEDDEVAPLFEVWQEPPPDDWEID